ncbi:XopAW family type III secretion system calcium-binding effector [Xylophilus sp. GW821-FHT01B05]
MTTINGAGSSAGSAWSAMQTARDARRAWMEKEMFSETDSDGSGSVDGTELQTVLDKLSSATGGSTAKASDLVSQFGTDGTLSQDQLTQAMQSLMPQRSTMDFAQSRSSDSTSAQGTAGDDLFGKVDSDGDGKLSAAEFQALQQKMSGQTDTSSTDSAASKLFAQLDTDGDGSLSQAEFDAGRPSAQGGGQGMAGGMPPPPPDSTSSTSASSSGRSTSATTYDPRDTNKDGVVSAEELLAAGSTSSTDSTDPLQALFKAVDSDGDGRIGRDEAAVLSQKITEALNSLSTGSTSSSSSSTDSTGSRNGNFDLSQLAQLVLKQYEQVGASASSGSSTGSTLSVVA